MSAVGERLRRERIRLGIDLTDLARDTRINRKYLEAIESDDRSQIPGGFFYRSFVRQYANAVGLDSGELERALDEVREAEAPVLTAALQSAQFPIKELDPIVVSTNRRIARGRIGAYILLLIGVVAGCGAFYSWWHRIEVNGGFTEVAKQTPSAASAVETSSTPALEVAQQPAVQPGATEPGSPLQAPPNVQQVVMTSPDDKVVLTVSAREETWVSITSDGKNVFNGVLAPSQTRVLGGKSRAFMRVGNAGGLEILWNGKPVGPLGGRGQVKTIEFTPENFRILNPQAPRSL